MLIRSWTEADAPAIDALLDPQPDPLWAGQGHRLHGAAREGEQWRRTLVGEQDDALVGAVTIARNHVHPGRYSCAVEVAPAHRRRGLARQLVEAALHARPQPLPLAAKQRERDHAARALLKQLGGTVYQRAPCPVVLPDDPRASLWSASHAGDARRLNQTSAAQLAGAFEDMYRWVHEDWSPVGPGSALADVCTTMIRELDGELSAGVWRGSRLAAAAFAFRNGNNVECVAETVRRAEPDGITLLATAIAAVLSAAAASGIESVEFDGHDDDPHLAPLVRTLPVATADPLLLVEVRDLPVARL